MNIMEIRELHLAAFMKVNGAEFVSYEKRKFVFKTDKPESEWRVQHSNSCCRRVDVELIELRKFIK